MNEVVSSVLQRTPSRIPWPRRFPIRRPPRGSVRITLAGAVAAVGAAAVVLPASADAATVTNPGFESGLDGWSCTGSAVASGTGAHTGSAALLATPTPSDNARCAQRVAVSPGTTYTLSAHVDGAYVFLGATGTGSTDPSTWTPSTGGAYQRLSVAFTTGAATSSVEIYLHGWYGQPGYRADDVTLAGPGDGAQPTPTTPASSSVAPSSVAPSPAAPSSVPPTSSAPAQPSSTPTGSGPSASPSASAGTGPGAALAACQHFSSVVPPERPAGADRDSATQAPRVDLSGRLPAPGNVRGGLAGGAVSISFDRVPGAVAYRVWRNAQSVARIEDWGQATLAVTDRAPCRGAYYTVAALRGDDSDASVGQLSQPYRLTDAGTLGAAALAVGTTLRYKVTSYNDAGQTASGYLAGLGLCAVDARYIPWGTRLKVDGYGYCYAADIGTWIQGEIVDVWLPGGEADTWGVQTRTITVVP